MTIIIVSVVVFILASIVWRFASHRHSIPCPTWLSWLVELDNPFTKINRAAVIVEHMDLKSGMSVLDVGCGPGRLTIPVAKQVGNAGKVVAVDIQAGMLARAKKKSQTENLSNIEFLLAGIGEGKLVREHFDRALLVTVLGEIPEKRAAMKEIFNTLIPGGILSVTEIIFDPHFQTKNTVTRLASEVGFRKKCFFGNSISYTLNFEKPYSG